ncbi:lipopolysaccharide biosynthesis protein [Halobacillus halophilus]|uniref:lipopolysaccharide biosynthesis protein n=1 Tax=Halobacillus halophilus TaxID=1570 RepID=UPI001CD4AB44|nr:oligosaccharide flippase family protein [Halobacillus halophilus]MCA1010719.1 oligosaccharide flippase family protein [Halobacillus halophilus]
MNKFKKLFENKFVRNIALVTSGTAFAQILSIVLSPIITRIYTPEEYGVLTVYISTLMLLSIGASLDYQKAIPLAQDNKAAYNLIFASFIVLTSFLLMLSLILLIWGNAIIELLNSEELANYLYLIPLGVLCLGGYNIILHFSLRIKDFTTVTRTKITRSLISNFSKISFGLLGFGPAGLIFAHVIGQSGGVYRLSLPLIKNRNHLKESFSLYEMKTLLKRYVRFPLYSAPSNYVYTIGNQAPILVLAALFGTTVSGHYGLANSIVNLPITLIAMSVSQVFYSEAASIGKSNPKKIKILSLKLTKKLALIGLVPLIIFFLFGPMLFSLVFGENWYEAGVYARLLSVIAYAHFIILPMGRILEILERQNIGLIMNAFRLVFIILVFLIANIKSFSAFETILLYSIINTISYITLFIIVQIILTKEE